MPLTRAYDSAGPAGTGRTSSPVVTRSACPSRDGSPVGHLDAFSPLPGRIGGAVSTSAVDGDFDGVIVAVELGGGPRVERDHLDRLVLGIGQPRQDPQHVV